MRQARHSHLRFGAVAQAVAFEAAFQLLGVRRAHRRPTIRRRWIFTKRLGYNPEIVTAALELLLIGGIEPTELPRVEVW